MTILDFIKSLIGSIGEYASFNSKEPTEHYDILCCDGNAPTKLLQKDVEEMLKDKTAKITLSDDKIKIKNRDKSLTILRK